MFLKKEQIIVNCSCEKFLQEENVIKRHRRTKTENVRSKVLSP
ncbi:hypothetical protein DOY81_006359 [Sarcophaga bullata]|nr:hypothetical protein DOY81_006359 [Sarcophaga bullata]